jgi:outer membrane protein assembly factor BamD (BamD/ComL family)
VCTTKPKTPQSTLVEQNDAFAEAIAAKRSGQAPLAIARFEKFLATYPRSPLAESATVERMKLLAAVDPARGAAAARSYLAAYPHGYARAEAEALAR